MKIPFKKIYRGQYPEHNMFRLNIWALVEPSGNSKDWYRRDVAGLKLTEKFVTEAIREKLAREHR